MEVQTRRKSSSGEDLRRVGESEALLSPTRKRPATAGRRFVRGHQIQPLSEEEQERPTLPFNVWSSLRRPDPLTVDEDIPSTSRSLQRPISGRAVRKVVPVEEELGTPDENTSVNLDIFTKATSSSTDPATGDIIQPDDDGQDNQTDQQSASQSVSLLAPPQLAGEQHAYIPYSIAKETITKICNEMKKMKERHVRIVDEIDSTYSEIEVETQQQFNDFVLRLKSQYSSKYTTFKQVIEFYQEELQKSKGYWQSTAESLAARNRELLQENQALYKNNKKGFELLEAKKEQAIKKVTEKVEREKKRRREECQKAVTMIRSLQAQQAEELQQVRQSATEVLEAMKAEHHTAIEKHVAEIAALKEELELAKKKAEQQTVLVEQAQLQKTEQPQVQETKQSPVQKAEQPQVQTVPVPEHKLDTQREALAASIQSSLKLKQKELDNLQHQLQSICHLVRSEAVLQIAIGGVATSLQEQHLQLKNTETDLQQQIESWKAEFRVSHSGANPTEDDCEDVREMNQKLLDTCNELASCSAKLSLIQTLGNVTAPAVPVVTVTDSESSEQPVAPVTTGEQPIVSGGQPMVDEYKEVIASLEKGNIELVSLNEQLSGRVSSLEKENSAYYEELQRLRTEVQTLKEGMVAAASQDITSPGKEKKHEGALDEDHSDDEQEEEKQETDEEELEEVETAAAAELQASTSQLEIPSTDKPPEITSQAQSEAPASKSKPTRRPTSDSKSPTREQAKEMQARAVDAKGENAQEIKKLREQLQQHKKQQQNDAAQIKALKSELKSVTKAAATGGSNLEDKKELKKKEKEIKELVKQFEITKKNLEKAQSALNSTETELKDLKKSNDQLQNEFHRKQDELTKIEVVAKQAVEAQERIEALSKELKAQAQELKTATENYNSERILRKKYYNMIEDMKGKIRVYCRARPLSKSEVSMSCHNITESPDEYTINVHSSRGLKEFQFDRIFLPEHGQEMVFEDTHNLVQSAVDGYNVCIFAYGQTGSGKTYTMIGGMEGKKVVLPGIAPRAFERIFQLADENKKKFSFKVSSYMLELYNDRLLDLFNTDHKANIKLDIKKDKKGMVFVQGSIVKEASTSEELYGHFEFGSQNRHTASTKMNAESSRSHLIIGIVIESTNLTTGTITKGKLSLVDLAGSERAAKTEASAEQLREAQSINKSLSALGDVISALSSGQDFVPYRNNKLTLLMQDSLGGNAKTLMFVNISPADYNMDETVISLTYASRVKLITNDAQKNADNKEISKLKGIIAKLRRGEEVDDEE